MVLLVPQRREICGWFPNTTIQWDVWRSWFRLLPSKLQVFLCNAMSWRCHGLNISKRGKRCSGSIRLHLKVLKICTSFDAFNLTVVIDSAEMIACNGETSRLATSTVGPEISISDGFSETQSVQQNHAICMNDFHVNSVRCVQAILVIANAE